jgi:SRSO17 transposase
MGHEPAADDEDAFKNRVVLAGVTPTTADHSGRFVVLLKTKNRPTLEVLLHVAFSRWHIERVFEDGKGEVGLDHFEVRKYRSLIRHLILSMVSFLFLMQQTQELQKKHIVDYLPSAGGRRSAA